MPELTREQIDDVITGSMRKYAKTVLELQLGLTDQERCILWNLLQEGYCSACGRVLERHKTCHCLDDE